MRNITADLESWAAPPLRGRKLLFVTFTCKRRTSAEILSAAITVLVRQLKRRVLGRANETLPLAHLAVIEATFHGGVHAHLLLEDPYSLPSDKAFPCERPVASLIRELWADLDMGLPAAQDVQPVYDLDGVLKYLQKTIRGASNLDALDLNNFYLPQIA